VENILTLPELEEQPLKDRIARMMTVDMSEMVDFKLFAETIAVFGGRLDKEKKFEFFFKVYDMDEDGLVGDGELFVVLRALVDGSLNDEQVESIVDQILHEYDKDGDSKLNFEEFKLMLTQEQIVNS